MDRLNCLNCLPCEDSGTPQRKNTHSNDGQGWLWAEVGKQPIRPKGQGRGIMVSDFIDEHNGFLQLPDDERIRTRSLFSPWTLERSTVSPQVRKRFRGVLEKVTKLDQRSKKHLKNINHIATYQNSSRSVITKLTAYEIFCLVYFTVTLCKDLAFINHSLDAIQTQQ